MFRIEEEDLAGAGATSSVWIVAHQRGGDIDVADIKSSQAALAMRQGLPSRYVCWFIIHSGRRWLLRCEIPARYLVRKAQREWQIIGEEY